MGNERGALGHDRKGHPRPAKKKKGTYRWGEKERNLDRLIKIHYQELDKGSAASIGPKCYRKKKKKGKRKSKEIKKVVKYTSKEDGESDLNPVEVRPPFGRQKRGWSQTKGRHKNGGG